MTQPPRQATEWDGRVSLRIRASCSKVQLVWGNRDKRPLWLNHPQCLLLVALKGGGRAESRSGQHSSGSKCNLIILDLAQPILLVWGRSNLLLLLSSTLGGHGQRQAAAVAGKAGEQKKWVAVVLGYRNCRRVVAPKDWEFMQGPLHPGPAIGNLMGIKRLKMISWFPLPNSGSVPHTLFIFCRDTHRPVFHLSD